MFFLKIYSFHEIYYEFPRQLAAPLTFFVLANVRVAAMLAFLVLAHVWVAVSHAIKYPISK